VQAITYGFLAGFFWASVQTSDAAQAAEPALSLPVKCAFPQECYIQSYVDLDPGLGMRDRACGINTYNGHKGTDFRLRSLDLMDRGVDVIASAAGKVVRVREGMRDIHMGLFGRKLASRWGAGNHVVIDHGDGWRTLYGHMRRGSVAVKTGDTVVAGQRLGFVGLSGMTEFPHLHFEVAKRGAIVDPFLGPDNLHDCKGRKRPMWKGKALKALNYRDRFLIAAGFADMPLSREALLYRLHVSDRLSRKAPNLVFHVDFAGLRVGDAYEMRIFAPSGNIFAENRIVSKKDVPVSFRLLGRKIAKRPAWPTGEYRGVFHLYRDQNGKRTTFIRHETRMRVE